MTFEAHGGDAALAPALIDGGPAATLPAPVIGRLLDLLARDDGYRARFEANPREALREIGFEPPCGCAGIRELDPVMAFDYFHGGLASKAKIAAGRAHWLACLRAQEHVFGPFELCA